MNDNNAPTFLRNFVWVLGSQTIVLISGLIKALIIPIVLGVEDFAYWQIYLFYVGYIGVVSFGYIDGIYLHYGGRSLQSLPLEKIRAANMLYLAALVLATLTVAFLSTQTSDPNRNLVFLSIAASIILVGVTSNISITLQAINMLKGYAYLNSADKIFFLASLFVLFVEELRTFWTLILVDIISKALVMLVLVYHYKQFYIGAFAKTHLAAREFIEKTRSGIKLMLANLSGMLVLGTGRIIIEYFGTLGTYALYAFATSIANVVLVSVSALSIVLYPNLRQQDKSSYLAYFERTGAAFVAFALLMLTTYFPAAAFIATFARSYLPVLDFLNAVFVIIVLQGRMQLLNNTFYMALRLEGRMLLANFSSLVLMIFLSTISYTLTQSVLAVVYSTLLTMLVRVYVSEHDLRCQMGSTLHRMAGIEIAFLGAFLALTSLAPLDVGAAIWSLGLAVVAIVYRKRLSGVWLQVWRRVLR